MSNFQTRQATIEDLPELEAVFVKSIRASCTADYTPEQIDVWASSIQKTERWNKALQEQYFIVALSANKIIGFGSIESGKYIDFLYVHPRYQGKGVASLIYSKLLEEASNYSNESIYSDVSITASNFFISKGFEIVHINVREIEGVEISNYRMERSFS